MKYCTICNITLMKIHKLKENKCTFDINFSFQNICLPQVSLHVHPAFTPPYLFPIGDVAITYTATDSSSNQATCTFHIKVIGKSSSQMHGFADIIQHLMDLAFPLASTISFLLIVPTGIEPCSNLSTCEAYLSFSYHCILLISFQKSFLKSS